MRWRTIGSAAGLTAVALAPVVLRAPRPQRAYPEGVRSVSDAIAACRASGLEGWELVDFARRLVHHKFTRYSILNLWESPAMAFANSRGYCNQYNSALWEILVALGFRAERVFATRVRQDINPWWRMGHMWVRVTVDGRTLDVCASRADAGPGAVEFVPVTEVLPFGPFTYLNTNNGMIVFTAFACWKSLLTGEPLPRWMNREFGSRVDQD
ncbi:hypothetical protein HJ590_00870 [Naumannella sp. ID2617S]|uniref:Transglutaminase-like domain-containing protein n=1 Tax=Enemella dayhoffiae TaxID=2016507 RepID=A0A255H9K2_9ACTN|nr:arylamine N-acetyltransferase [Enemella dayhoffiae]NNG18141.1 hypothetical protein [Naumannella sp. ID2617S]OYO23926.1 hypothetical protein CGZ93_05275 [Enemella dayhoffiae]